MTLDYLGGPDTLPRETGGTCLTEGIISKRTVTRATSQGRQAASEDWESGEASLEGRQPC